MIEVTVQEPGDALIWTTAVTAIAALASALLGAVVGARATRKATREMIAHERRAKRLDRTHEAAELALDVLLVVTNNPDALMDPHGRHHAEQAEKLRNGSFRLANRAWTDDAHLANLCHEFANQMRPDVEWSRMYTLSSAFSGALVFWLTDADAFRERPWALRDWHQEMHDMKPPASRSYDPPGTYDDPPSAGHAQA